ncbi:MAG: response regulator transcription factor [Actinomycetota bacterium]
MNGPRVLVVEDDEQIASLVQRTLAGAGIDSDLASTGPDGLWKAREGSYGAIVLDLMLPGMNGYEVCRTLRSEGVATAIIMLTAKSGEYDETDGFEMGADDYLRKPFSTAVLAHRVQALLRRTPGTTVTERLTRGQLSFDLQTRTCELDGAEVALTAREATLLETLLRSGETPLSRADLLDRVWGMDFDGDPNVVDVYVGYLRRKLGRERIVNRRGVGFRVAP